MNEGLEALQNLRCMTSLSQDCPYEESNDLCDIIEKELKEGELAITYVNAIFDILGDVRNGDFIIDIIAKQRKALEIIKRKYDFGAGGCLTCCGLTQEEYDLLKEVLL